MKEKLIAIQARESWSDMQMAERLGVSRSLWTMIRNGVLPLSERVQMRAAGAFPELLGDLLTSVGVTRQQPPAEQVA